MKKINLYVFIQIIKSCTLVFFIFVSIAWLLQISRLFSYLNNLQIDFVNVLFLSFFLIPNLINVTLPFIIIFGLIIAFIKFDKDKEIIAIFSLGLSIKEILKPFFLISIIAIFLYLFLNLFFSPYIYDKYKQKEFDLRNSINLDNINISNFIQLDENLILDFSKKEDVFEDVFIRFIGENENIVFAKKARIIKEPKKFIFNLSEGFKLSFMNNKIEKLEFENYKLNFPLRNENIYNNKLLFCLKPNIKPLTIENRNNTISTNINELELIAGYSFKLVVSGSLIKLIELDASGIETDSTTIGSISDVDGDSNFTLEIADIDCKEEFANYFCVDILTHIFTTVPEYHN